MSVIELKDIKRVPIDVFKTREVKKLKNKLKKLKILDDEFDILLKEVWKTKASMKAFMKSKVVVESKMTK